MIAEQEQGADMCPDVVVLDRVRALVTHNMRPL
jgi:hypothetical protein